MGESYLRDFSAEESRETRGFFADSGATKPPSAPRFGGFGDFPLLERGGGVDLLEEGDESVSEKSVSVSFSPFFFFSEAASCLIYSCASKGMRG